MSYKNTLKEFCARKGLILKDMDKHLEKHKIISPIVNLEGCVHCGTCCKEVMLVPMTVKEALYIANILSAPPKDLFVFDSDQAFISDTRPCKFLNEYKGKFYCSIHSFKPKNCARSPVISDENGEEFVVNYSYCNLCLQNSYEAIKLEVE